VALKRPAIRIAVSVPLTANQRHTLRLWRIAFGDCN